MKKRSVLAAIGTAVLSLAFSVSPSASASTSTSMSEAPGVASSTYPCSIVAKSPNINVRKEPTTKSQVVSVMRYGDVWAAYCDLVPGENIAVCGSAAHNLWVRVPIGFVHKECVYWVQVPTP